MSKVAHCRQMNPVVGVAEAMIERCRRQRRSFSQVTQAESNEEDWKRPKTSLQKAAERRESIKRNGDIRHNQKLLSVVLCESHLEPEDSPKANKAESWWML